MGDRTAPRRWRAWGGGTHRLLAWTQWSMRPREAQTRGRILTQTLTKVKDVELLPGGMSGSGGSRVTDIHAVRPGHCGLPVGPLDEFGGCCDLSLSPPESWGQEARGAAGWGWGVHATGAEQGRGAPFSLCFRVSAATTVSPALVAHWERDGEGGHGSTGEGKRNQPLLPAEQRAVCQSAGSRPLNDAPSQPSDGKGQSGGRDPT